MNSLNKKSEFCESNGNGFCNENVSDHHSAYEVKNENGNSIGIDILVQYFGNLWESALDRLNHQLDGFLVEIHHQGRKFMVFRKMANKNNNSNFRLWVVK